MRMRYRGHDIEVKREKSMAGWSMIFYSIFRAADGYECTSGFSETTDTVRDYVDHMKARVDAELAEADPWLESEAA
jgi:hypothetical protein